MDTANCPESLGYRALCTGDSREHTAYIGHVGSGLHTVPLQRHDRLLAGGLGLAAVGCRLARLVNTASAVAVNAQDCLLMTVC